MRFNLLIRARSIRLSIIQTERLISLKNAKRLSPREFYYVASTELGSVIDYLPAIDLQGIKILVVPNILSSFPQHLENWHSYLQDVLITVFHLLVILLWKDIQDVPEFIRYKYFPQDIDADYDLLLQIYLQTNHNKSHKIPIPALHLLENIIRIVNTWITFIFPYQRAESCL